MQEGSLIARFGRARRDPSLAVLEGFHPIKHALRFDAHVLEVVCSDPAGLERMASELAPDISERLLALSRPVEPGVLAQLVPLVPSTAVVGLAERARYDLATVLADPSPRPLVLLEDPRDLGNMGACVRVAAAAGIAGVLSTGSHDPWYPDALRGAAGLHYAVPVCRLADLESLPRGRPLLAFDPDGEELDPAALPARALLAFGSERRGLSAPLLARADERLRVAMQPGVSSLNLATSVAAVLFAWRLAR